MTLSLLQLPALVLAALLVLLSCTSPAAGMTRNGLNKQSSSTAAVGLHNSTERSTTQGGALLSRKHVAVVASQNTIPGTATPLNVTVLSAMSLTNKSEKFAVASITVHPQYNPVTGDNDLAILTLAEEIPKNHEYLEPRGIFNRSMTPKKSKIIIGYGYRDSNKEIEVEGHVSYRIVMRGGDKSTCKRVIPNMKAAKEYDLNGPVYCAVPLEHTSCPWFGNVLISTPNGDRKKPIALLSRYVVDGNQLKNNNSSSSNSNNNSSPKSNSTLIEAGENAESTSVKNLKCGKATVAIFTRLWPHLDFIKNVTGLDTEFLATAGNPDQVDQPGDDSKIDKPKPSPTPNPSKPNAGGQRATSSGAVQTMSFTSSPVIMMLVVPFISLIVFTFQLL
ncbi:hypothetical protein GQ42DRAFT_164624 [Ramicandelaber brevisporus]|nr:hypothetical protein GQ42DRAFT_164624 [Ramicandelaber brevisporus]